MPKVSIIVPVYNVEKYLCECLDSILNQTYKEFELILVDDGSTDKSGEICDKYKGEHNNIKVIHQENQGQAAARNNGVKISEADWIMFVDSDDVIHYDLLDFLYKSVIESGAGMAVCGRVSSEVIPNDFYKKYIFSYSLDIVTNDKLMEYFNDKKYYFWAPFPSIIKKEIVESIPFPEGRIYEDNAISCQLIYASKKLAKVPFVMYYYRDNPKGTMNSPFTIRDLDYLLALETQIAFFQKIDCDKMCIKISAELIQSAFYYYEKSKIENNLEIEKIVKKKIKIILRKYNRFIEMDKRFNKKADRIFHPYLFKIKKKLNIYK